MRIFKNKLNLVIQAKLKYSIHYLRFRLLNSSNKIKKILKNSKKEVMLLRLRWKDLMLSSNN